MTIYRKIAIPIFIIIAAIRFTYLINQIESHNMDYYHGKDNGAFVLLESIIIFSALFYFVMSKKNRIINGLLGVLIGIIISIIVYLIFGTGIMFPTISCCSLIIIFFIIEYLRDQRNKTNASS